MGRDPTPQRDFIVTAAYTVDVRVPQQLLTDPSILKRIIALMLAVPSTWSNADPITVAALLRDGCHLPFGDEDRSLSGRLQVAYADFLACDILKYLLAEADRNTTNQNAVMRMFVANVERQTDYMHLLESEGGRRISQFLNDLMTSERLEEFGRTVYRDTADLLDHLVKVGIPRRRHYIQTLVALTKYAPRYSPVSVDIAWALRQDSIKRLMKNNRPPNANVAHAGTTHAANNARYLSNAMGAGALRALCSAVVMAVEGPQASL